MIFHWILLIFSVAALLSSFSLIKHCAELDKILDDFTDRREVSYLDYVTSAVLGYTGLPASLFATCACVYLLIIDYFW